VARGEN
jgi:hypothetical protein